MCTPRVYLNIGQTFYNEAPLPAAPDFLGLIDMVAKSKKKYDRKGKEVSLLNWMGCPSHRKTRAFIVQEANKLIHQLGQFQSEHENMYKRTSQIQIRELEGACRCRRKGGRISGYALLILYIIYKIIRDNTDSQDDILLQKLADYISALAERYYQYNQTDEIARFLLASYWPVSRVFQSREAVLPTAEDFPAIPRTHVGNQ